MRITSNGQVTIPAEIRKQAGLLPDTEVDCKFDGNVVQSSAPTPETRAVAARAWWPICGGAAILP